LGKGESEVAGAAAKVERVSARSGGGQFYDTAFPVSVQSEALEIIQQVIASRNPGEKIVDLCGALIARRIIGVAHADSLAAGRDEAKPRNIFALGNPFATFRQRMKAFSQSVL